MEEKIIKILKGIKPSISFKDSKINFIKNNYFDSFDIISIISELEKNFKIKIKTSEIKPNNFSNIKKIQELIKKNKK